MRYIPSFRKLARWGSQLAWRDHPLARRKPAQTQRLSVEALEDRTAPAVITWDGGGGNFDFRTALNWDTDTIPGVNDDAVITTTGITVTHNTGTTTVRSLTSAAAFTLGSSLTLLTDSAINAAFTLNSGGVLGGDGDLTLAGPFNWTGGQMTGAGVTFLSAGATATLSGTAVKDLNGRRMDSAGTVNLSGTGAFQLYNGATFNNLSGATFTASTDATLQGFDSARFDNAGAFRKTGGLAGGTTNVNVRFDNGGSVEAQFGTLSLNAGGDGSGSYSAAAGSTLAFAGGTHVLSAASSVGGDGAVRFAGGVAQVGGSYAVAGSTAVTGGFVGFNGGATTAGGSLAAGGTLGGTGTLTVTAAFTWTGGTMQGPGTTRIAAGAALTLTGAAVKDLNGRRLEVAGAAVWESTGGVQAFNGAVLSTLAGGTFTASTDATLQGFDSARFDNAGAFRKTGGLAGGVTTVAMRFNNTGTVDVQTERLTLTNLSNFAGTTLRGGTYRISGGSTLQINGADIRTNRANIILNGSTSRIVSNAANNNALTNFFVNAGGANFTVENGATFTTLASVAFSNQGTITVGAGSSFTVGGTFLNFAGTTLTGGTYNLAGTFRFTGANIQTNAARIILDGTSGGIVNQSDAPALTNFATNAAGAEFALLNGATLEVGAFGNAGQLTVGSGSLFRSTGTYTQTGATSSTALSGGTLEATTVDLQAGTLTGSGTVTGSLANAGTVNPGGAGAAGLLTVTGDYTQSSGGTLQLDLGGLTPGTLFDRLAVGGAATLDGTLAVSALSGYLPNISDVFEALTFASRTGTFATTSGLDLGSGRVLRPIYGATAVTLVTNNRAPVLVAIPDQSATVGVELSLTASASDPDGDSFTFSLGEGAPAGAAIDATTGVFTWTPSEAGTFTVTVLVTDAATPSLSDSKTFTITVT